MSNVLITGSSGNLGRAVSKKFLDENHTLIAAIEKGDHFNKHKNCTVIETNLLDEKQADGFIKNAIKAAGKIDFAVLLVGGFAMGAIADTDKEALDKMYMLNFETAYFCLKPLLQHMKKNNFGRIVLIGSRPGLHNELGSEMVAYSLSKSLIFALAKIANADAGKHNVITSVIIPSIIDTPVNRKAMPDADFSKWVTPQKLAEIIYFSCSKNAADLREPIFKVYNES